MQASISSSEKPQTDRGSIVCQDDRGHIVRTGAALVLASALGNGLNYAFGIYVARWIGVEDFGLYGLGVTIFNVLTLTAVLGMDIGAIKFISHHIGMGNHAKARETAILAITIAAATGLIAAIGLAMLSQSVAAMYRKPNLALPLLWFAAAIPFAIVGNVALSATQAFQVVRYTILIKYGWEPIAKFLLVGGLFWAGYQLNGVLAAIVTTFAISAFLFMGALRTIASVGRIDVSVWNKQEVMSLATFCMPLAISNAVGVVAPRTDVLILGYWGNAHDVGLYVAAFQTAAIMSLIVGAFNTGLAPIISRAWSSRDIRRMASSYQSASRLSFTLALPIFCVAVLFAENILELFGPEFLRGSSALIILSMGQIINGATGSANTMLLMSGHSKLVMRNTIGMGIILLIATGTLIPFWGMQGAAIAASTVFVLTNALRVYQVWQIHHVQPFTGEFVKPIASAVASTTIVYLLRDGLSVTAFDPALMLTLGTCYGVGVWLLGMCEEDLAVLEPVLLRLRLFGGAKEEDS